VKKKIGFCLLFSFLLLGLIILVNSIQTVKKQAVSSQKQQFINITDSMERSVQVPYLPKRIVSVNSDVSEIMCALGLADRIVGVSDTSEFPPLLKDKAKVGESFTPSVEKILALKPDLVFGYGSFLKPEIIAKIEQGGIPVVILDCYKLKNLSHDIQTLGKIFGKEKEAEQYNQILQKYENLIKARISKLSPAEKPITYVESYSDYSTVATGVGAAEMLEQAGGRNAAQSLPNAYPKVSAEWVVAQNPQVIIKALNSRVSSGYGQASGSMQKEYERVIARPGWKNISAVKNDRVYLMCSDIWTGPRAIVGVAYMAKWLHPDLFKDIDPEAIHKEILEKFHNLELKGAWVY